MRAVDEVRKIRGGKPRVCGSLSYPEGYARAQRLVVIRSVERGEQPISAAVQAVEILFHFRYIVKIFAVGGSFAALGHLGKQSVAYDRAFRRVLRHARDEVYACRKALILPARDAGRRRPGVVRL